MGPPCEFSDFDDFINKRGKYSEINFGFKHII
jgi:hypothetical protein